MTIIHKFILGCYGKFDARELEILKRILSREFNVATNISGAGPNMQFLYNTENHADLAAKISPVVVPWFKDHGVDMRIENTQIAESGAYDYAEKKIRLENLVHDFFDKPF